MGIIKKFKSWFGIPETKMGDIDLQIKEPTKEDMQVINEVKQEIGSQKTQVDTSETIDKFDAEFHNPRLTCFYCSEQITEGRIRFMCPPGSQEDAPFHKRCFKKLKQGRLPGQ